MACCGLSRYEKQCCMNHFFEKKYIPNVAQSLCLFDNFILSNEAFLTIAIPTYNRPELLLESIKSVLDSCNKAKFFNFELVIVDNSADSSSWNYLGKNIDLGLLKNRLRYFLNSENLGMFGNWNRCLELTTTPWITILNDDDLFKENAIPTFLKYFKQEQDLFLLQNIILNEKDKTIKSKVINSLKAYKITTVHKLTLDDYYWGMPSMGSLGVFFKRDIALNIGGFPEEFFPINDWVFFSKYIKKVKRGIKIHIPSTFYRIALNESMKPEVAHQSLQLSYKFRTYLGVIRNGSLNNFFCKMFIIIRIHGNKRLFNSNTDIEAVSTSFDLKWYHHMLFPFFRYAVFIKKLI